VLNGRKIQHKYFVAWFFSFPSLRFLFKKFWINTGAMDIPVYAVLTMISFRSYTLSDSMRFK